MDIDVATPNGHRIPRGSGHEQPHPKRARKFHCSRESCEDPHIRRLKIAEAIASRDGRGMKIVDADSLACRPTGVGERAFNATKDYLYPISFAEIKSNPYLKRNKGN